MYQKFMLSLAIVFSIVLIGCSTKKVTTIAKLPPKVNLNVNKIAVINISGDKNNYFANTLTSIFIKSKKDGKYLFTVIERGDIERILQEQKFQMSITDPRTGVKLGKLIGLDAGFSGGLDFSESSRTVIESRLGCSYGVLDCGLKDIYCKRTDSSLKATLILTDYSTGAILYSKSFTKGMYTIRCDDNKDTTGYTTASIDGNDKDVEIIEMNPESTQHLTNTGDHYIDLANLILMDIARDFGEYQIKTNVTLDEETYDLKDADKEDFKAAIEYAENGRMETSCEIWSRLQKTNKDTISIEYNLGICAETYEDLDRALMHFKRADQLTDKFNKNIDNSIKRIEIKISLKNKRS